MGDAARACGMFRLHWRIRLRGRIPVCNPSRSNTSNAARRNPWREGVHRRHTDERRGYLCLARTEWERHRTRLYRSTRFCRLAQVHAALAYYYDHAEEIREQVKTGPRRSRANQGRESAEAAGKGSGHGREWRFGFILMKTCRARGNCIAPSRRRRLHSGGCSLDRC